MIALNKKFILKRILPVIAGALVGYLYYYFIGCNSGRCIITGNPYISTIYGSLIGLLIAFPTKSKEKSNERKEDN